MLFIQIVLISFLIFALSRVFLRFRDKKVSMMEFLFWAFIFITAIFVVVFPSETTKLAKWFGIGRGSDLIVYASIAVLFYLVFRIYVYLEDLRHEITEVVRKIALNKK